MVIYNLHFLYLIYYIIFLLILILHFERNIDGIFSAKPRAFGRIQTTDIRKPTIKKMKKHILLKQLNKQFKQFFNLIN